MDLKNASDVILQWGTVALAVGGASALVIRYAKTLRPGAGDRMEPFSSPELKEYNADIRRRMTALCIKPTQGRAPN